MLHSVSSQACAWDICGGWLMDPFFGMSSLCLQGLLSLAPETETFLCVSHVLFIVTLHSYDIIASYVVMCFFRCKPGADAFAQGMNDVLNMFQTPDITLVDLRVRRRLPFKLRQPHATACRSTICIHCTFRLLLSTLVKPNNYSGHCHLISIIKRLTLR